MHGNVGDATSLREGADRCFRSPLVLANGMQAALRQSGSAKSHHNDVDCLQGTRPNFDPVVSFRTWILRRLDMSGLAGPTGS